MASKSSALFWVDDAQATQEEPRTACGLGNFSVALDLCESNALGTLRGLVFWRAAILYQQIENYQERRWLSKGCQNVSTTDRGPTCKSKRNIYHR